MVQVSGMLALISKLSVSDGAAIAGVDRRAAAAATKAIFFIWNSPLTYLVKSYRKQNGVLPHTATTSNHRGARRTTRPSLAVNS